MIGAGGIGCPVALALATAHARGELQDVRLVVLDDDLVEAENLHRQILFEERDLSTPKGIALARRVQEISPTLEVRGLIERFLPDSALALAESADILVDASDNFATRFLAADAAHLARRPLVSAASIRWLATVVLGLPQGPCYRCVFEDIPEGDAPDCASAGIIGPICGVAGAIAADLAIQLVRGNHSANRVFSYDGRTDLLRAISVRRRESCALCGPSANITTIDAPRYAAVSCESPAMGAA